MPYTPVISKYKPFYFQATGDSLAWDTRDYGMVAQSQPNPDNIEMKEPYKNDWFDENGDEEYLGKLVGTTWNSALKVKATEYEVKFFIKAFGSTSNPAINTLNILRSQFRSLLVYKPFAFYDTWNERGYTSCRFVKDSVDVQDITDEEAWMIFTMTIKILDPTAKADLQATTGGYIIVEE